MKKILTTFTFAISLIANSQNMLRIDIVQDFTSPHVSSGYSLKNRNIGLYSTGASISYMINPFRDHFYFEPFLAFSFSPKSTEMKSSISRNSLNSEYIISADNGSTFVDQYSIESSAKTTHFSTGFNLIKKVNSYFWIGGGLNAVMLKTVISDQLITDSFIYDQNKYSLVYRLKTPIGFESTNFQLTVPIIIRGSIPLGDNYLFGSIVGHISQRARLQASIGFAF